nr:MAG TPA: hypothetical protein [Caudoviricetes sp.]
MSWIWTPKGVLFLCVKVGNVDFIGTLCPTQ